MCSRRRSGPLSVSTAVMQSPGRGGLFREPVYGGENRVDGRHHVRLGASQRRKAQCTQSRLEILHSLPVAAPGSAPDCGHSVAPPEGLRRSAGASLALHGEHLFAQGQQCCPERIETFDMDGGHSSPSHSWMKIEEGEADRPPESMNLSTTATRKGKCSVSPSARPWIRRFSGSLPPSYLTSSSRLHRLFTSRSRCAAKTLRVSRNREPLDLLLPEPCWSPLFLVERQAVPHSMVTRRRSLVVFALLVAIAAVARPRGRPKRRRKHQPGVHCCRTWPRCRSTGRARPCPKRTSTRSR